MTKYIIMPRHNVDALETLAIEIEYTDRDDIDLNDLVRTLNAATASAQPAPTGLRLPVKEIAKPEAWLDWQPGEKFYEESSEEWQAEFGDSEFLVEQASYIPSESEEPATVPTFFRTMTPNEAQVDERKVLRFARIPLPKGEDK